MSGALNALVGSQNVESFVVTVADVGGGIFGRNAGGGGGVTPSTIRGLSLASVYSVGAVDLRIEITPGTSLTQSFFKHILVQDDSGAIRKYNSSDAVFTGDASEGQWDWSGGTNVWDQAHASRLLLVYF